MESKKINIEIKKIDNSSKEIEWTETLEIPYDTNNKFSEDEKRIIEKEFSKKSDNNKSVKENPLLNTTVLEMKTNPFYQPSMNTFEFSSKNSTLVVSLTNSNNEKITHEDEIIALEKLLEKNIISKKEFDSKMKFINSKK